MQALPFWRSLGACAVFSILPLFAASASDQLDGRVHELFKARCAECHDEAGGQSPQLDELKNLFALRNDQKLISPGEPQKSKLYQLVTREPNDRGRMPQSRSEQYREPLTDKEKALLAEWITGAEAQRPFISETAVLQSIIDDLRRAAASDRPYYRYLSFHNLSNQSAVTSDALVSHREALSKLINSLSWLPKIVRPKVIDSAEIIHRIDLRDYDWSQAMWARVASHNPYGFVRPELDRSFAELSGTNDIVWLRADWFVFACAQPPLYEHLLFSRRVPALLSDPLHAEQHLERYLGVDVKKNLFETTQRGTRSVHDLFVAQNHTISVPDTAVRRAGFRKSGVSLHGNRLIERHPLPDGRGYWKSFDFAAYVQGSTNDLFSHPLGPVGMGLSKDDRFAFRHDGGEMIFHLPNGLQGYLLTTAAGKSLARAPTTIVQDSERDDGQILNGVSCMKCHHQGMKDPPGGLSDDVRGGTFTVLSGVMSSDERRAVENLYMGAAEFQKVIAADRERFMKALGEAGAAASKVEPINFLYEHFSSKGLINEQVATVELDLDRTQMKVGLIEWLRGSNRPETLSAAVQLGLPKGYSRRDFLPAYTLIASEVYGPAVIRRFTPLAFEEFNEGSDATSPPAALQKNRPPQFSPFAPHVKGSKPTAGAPFTVSGAGVKMFWISPGTFLMGSPDSEADRNSDEGPQTRVTHTRGFWLGQTEVTQAQWEAVMFSNPSKFVGESNPVENVSWEEAMEFCRKLTEQEQTAERLPMGYRYTLPTEAQWEYTCRAGSTGAFAGTLAVMARFSANSGGTTHPVAQKQANAWGLYDMHGNVAEWCLDRYEGKLSGGSVSDPAGAPSGSHRVRRGGSWFNPAGFCRSSVRVQHLPGKRADFLGFRLALTSVP